MKHITEIQAASHRSSLQESTRSRHLETIARRASRLILAFGITISASFAAVQAETWATVDDMFPSASAYAATTDAAGNIFVAGSARDALGRPTAVVMKSSDGGQTWDNDPSTPDIEESSDAISTTDGSFAEFRAIASARVASGGNVFADHVVTTGRAKRVPTAAGPMASPWLIRRSTDAGATWVMLDEFVHPAYNHGPGNMGPWGVALDSSGTIFAAGSALEAIVSYKGKSASYSNVNHWLIRKGLTTASGTVEWKTIDFAYPTTHEWDRENCFPSAVACVGNNVFVVGGGGPDGVYWHVLKSADGGTTWTVADNFRFDRSDNSHAYGIAADSTGNLFVVGVGNRSSQNTRVPYWIIRKGAPDGTAWTTVDQFQLPGGTAVASAVTVDRNNDVHVTGSGLSSATGCRWITRQRSAVNGLWSTTDNFAFASGSSSAGKAIAADQFGDVFAAGYGCDAAGVSHWLVRRKLAP